MPAYEVFDYRGLDDTVSVKRVERMSRKGNARIWSGKAIEAPVAVDTECPICMYDILPGDEIIRIGRRDYHTDCFILIAQEVDQTWKKEWTRIRGQYV